MQTSITTWLKKPSTVTQPPPPPTPPASTSQTPPTPLASASQTSPTPPLQPPTENDHPEPPTTEDIPPTPPSPTPPLNPPSKSLQQENNNNNNTIKNEQPEPPLPFTHRLPPLPPQITLSPCEPTHLPSLKRLNTTLLPIPYPPKFYTEILSDAVTSDITLVALWHDGPTAAAAPRLIGAIRCRLLPDPEAEHPLLYISTLGVLAPYRRFGVATWLLQRVLVGAVKRYGCRAVGAHVWEANEEGRVWYRKRGFRETRLEEGYYRRLTPQGAWVVRRDVGVRDLMVGL